MNYMKQVAQMLGVELDEEFYIKGDNYRYKITNDGIAYFCESNNGWIFITWAIHEILIGKLEIVKKPKTILTKQEREYLRNVIKPFRGRVRLICKSSFSSREHIAIILDDSVDKDLTGYLALPTFKEGTMCKGMELDKSYTIEELGL